MRPFSLLIKPASADCNLRCDYCFYLDRCELYPESKVHRMSENTLERLISSYMATEQPLYVFNWQGGEPTLMGIGFFRKVIELQKKYGKRGAHVANGFQTNAVLIDDEFAAHFAKYNFLLGVSLDGPEEIHNYYRKNIKGSGSYANVINAIRILRRHNVEFNILILVSSVNVHKAKEIYTYFRENGFKFLQFIPCVEFANNNSPLPFTISGREWGEFLCEVFDIWFKHDTTKVSIRLFDSLLALMVDNIRNICHIGRNCCQYFVVEYNGDVYPCDFFVRKELKLGNITDDSWKELLVSQLYNDFGKEKVLWNDTCSRCEFLHYCSGDCLKQRIYGNIANPRNLSWLCKGWKMFYRHSLPRFEKLADKIKRERKKALPNRTGRDGQILRGDAQGLIPA